MIRKFFNHFKFFLETWLLRGALFQLLFIAILIVLISLLAGALVFMFPSEFKWLGESVWWAFLRLTDPGYLGDDKGLVLQFVSTIVTVLGYVLFMGALIAIMTQWLQSTMRRLESGLTPIVQNDHVLVLGWTNRTPTIVRELVLSEGRVKRFLKRLGASRLNIVILAEEVTSALVQGLREELGARWNQRQIKFRSGTALRIEHLLRVDFLKAGVIIIPGSDFSAEGAAVIDTWTIKALLTISNYGHAQGVQKLPLVVAEMVDARKLPIAKRAYRGDIEVIASDAVISRLITQNVRHRGLSFVYSELLTHSEGNEIYIRECPQFNGEKFQNMVDAFPQAILLGTLRHTDKGYAPVLNPPDGFQVQRGDRLVLLGRKYDQTAPLEDYNPEPMTRGPSQRSGDDYEERRLLIMGWNHKVPAMIQEFESYQNENFHIDILSLVSVREREEFMFRYDKSHERVVLRHLYGDYTAPAELGRVRPEQYDNIVLVANSWLESGEASDARTILGYLLLRDMLHKSSKGPEILIELMDSENEKLFQQRAGEVIISPFILSHILAHVGLRRELNVVFDELFTVGGAEIYFRSAVSYQLVGRDMTFQEISRSVFQQGDIALGIRSDKQREDHKGGILLNPPRDSGWYLREEDEIVVLTTYS